MVRELQILSAPVDIQCITEQLTGHRRAFDMPAWSSIAPGTGPINFTRLGRFPEDEILRVLFTLIHIDSNTELQFIDVLMGQLAVFLKFASTVKDVATMLISVPSALKLLNKIDNQGHILRNPRIGGRTRNPQSIQILIVSFNKCLCDFRNCRAHLIGFADQLIVDIRKVHDKVHVIFQSLQIAANHVKKDSRTRIPNMNITINGRSAYIYLSFARLLADEPFFLTG
ncbi:hypothetical protein D3C81_1049640 [compost metagenome]